MAYLSLLIAILIDFYALHGLILTPTASSLIDYLWIHSVASMLFAFGFQVFVRPFYSHPRWVLLLTTFVLIFLVPLGWIVIACVLVALLHPKAQASDYSEMTDRRSLPFEPFRVSDAPHQGVGGLGGIIKNASDPIKRQMAVLALNNVSNRDAIPLLKVALSDSEDDVRLLAYARLDHLENEMNYKINQYKIELTEHDEAENATFHQLIAEQLWELSYLGLSEGETQRYHLEQAIIHVKASLEITENAGLRLLIGRIYLALNQCDLAEQAFKAAQSAGYEIKRILPYLAEVAYKNRQYHTVSTYLQELESDQCVLNQLKEYWV